jgi:heme-degrading monooxygenase HmoA
MYASIRWYGGNTELADQLAARADEVKSVIGGISGFQAYYLVRVEGGTVSVSVFDDQAGADESARAAAAYLKENLPDVAVDPPAVNGGEAVISA